MLRLSSRKEIQELIRPGWKVLDVGSGDNPFCRATVLLDRGPRASTAGGRTFSENPRAKLARDTRPLVLADVAALPFQDSAFDFVYAAHVLEHVNDPAKCIGELTRVAPRGYVEVPRSWFEFVDGSPFHSWLIDFAGEELIFRPKTEEERAFSLSRRVLDRDKALFLDFYGQSVSGLGNLDPGGESLAKSVCHICLLWENSIEYRIEPPSSYASTAADQVELPKGNVPLSVIIHTKDEAENIQACLASCVGWADEVIVADMESRDTTRYLAALAGGRVVSVRPQEEFDRSRNESAACARNDWILYLDADERLTEPGRRLIEELIAGASMKVAAFQLPMRVFSFGKAIDHAGHWWPSYKSPQLLRNGEFHFPGPVHLPAEVRGSVVRVEPTGPDQAILHFSHPSLDAYFAKLNRYTGLEAKKLRASGRSPSWREAARRFGSVSAWYYDETSGKRDGLAGFLLSLGSGIYEAVSELKFMESEGEQEIPCSAEEFFSEVLNAAKTAPIADQSSVPTWVKHLGSWMTETGTKPRVFQLGSGNDFNELSQMLADLPKGAFVLLHDTSHAPIEDQRRHVERVGKCPCHLLEGGSRFGRWWFFWARDGARRELSVLSVTHSGALQIMGGGEVQLFQSIKALRQRGVVSDVGTGCLPEGEYALAHLYSLHHQGIEAVLKERGLPYVLSPIYWDRTELSWVAPRLMSVFASSSSPQDLESGYATVRAQRTLALKGFRGPLPFSEENLRLLVGAQMVLPNARSEGKCLLRAAAEVKPVFALVPNAVQAASPGGMAVALPPDIPDHFVLCVGRIEPNKNQLSLIYALRGIDLPLVLVGAEADEPYGKLCRQMAGPNVHFLGSLTSGVVAELYKRASVHALPSFGETPGLASLEAAICGCPLVVSDRGAEREYFGDLARYCDPLDPDSIRKAIEESIGDRSAARTASLKEKVSIQYTWENAARILHQSYCSVLLKCNIAPTE
ncbi:MAG: glycosyltransferase [Armatimonadetes bacterium]|nr:glycosyltransferase [Armatimonadota bacterium]